MIGSLVTATLDVRVRVADEISDCVVKFFDHYGKSYLGNCQDV
jgi:hypothetical protein